GRRVRHCNDRLDRGLRISVHGHGLDFQGRAHDSRYPEAPRPGIGRAVSGRRSWRLGVRFDAHRSQLGRQALGSQTLSVALPGDLVALFGDLVALFGDLAELFGDLVALFGDLVELLGDLVALFGDLVALFGDLAGLLGDLAELLGDLVALLDQLEIGQERVVLGGEDFQSRGLEDKTDAQELAGPSID